MPRGQSKPTSILFGPRKEKRNQTDPLLSLANIYYPPSAKTNKALVSLFKGSSYLCRVEQKDQDGTPYSHDEICLPNIGLIHDQHKGWVWRSFITREESGLLETYTGDSFDKARESLCRAVERIVPQRSNEVLQYLKNYSYNDARELLHDKEELLDFEGRQIGQSPYHRQARGSLDHVLLAGADRKEGSLFRCFPPEAFRDRVDQETEPPLRNLILKGLVSDKVGEYFYVGKSINDILEADGKGRDDLKSLNKIIDHYPEWASMAGEFHKKVYDRTFETSLERLNLEMTYYKTPYYMIEIDEVVEEAGKECFKETLVEYMIEDSEDHIIKALLHDGGEVLYEENYPNTPISGAIGRMGLYASVDYWQDPVRFAMVLDEELEIALTVPLP